MAFDTGRQAAGTVPHLEKYHYRVRLPEKLTELFQYNIPQRWSIAHLYQAILNGEEHVKEIAFVTTLAGYIHWQLTGEKVAGCRRGIRYVPH